MRDPKKVEGGRALLFERLAAGDPRAAREGARPFRVHETAALKESVRRELVRLLNTRSSAGGAGAARRPGGGRRGGVRGGRPRPPPARARGGGARRGGGLRAPGGGAPGPRRPRGGA